MLRQALVSLSTVGIVLLAPAFPVQAQYLCGDADGSGAINVADLTYMVGYLFQGGAPPQPLAAGDCDENGQVDVADLTYLVAYLFQGGPEPCAQPGGGLIGYTGCKSLAAPSDSTPPNLDCIEYDYDGSSVLSITHVNSGFNCCPSRLEAEITIAGNVITIDESEVFDTVGPCYCLCLFDLDIEITSLTPGQYTIVVNQLYLDPGDEVHEFTIELTSSPSTGSHCIVRDHYPWGFYQTAAVASGPCKTFSRAASSDTIPSDLDCLFFEYDGQDVMSVTHINAGFNCCPDGLAALITIEGGIITIEEKEFISVGCDCLCLFDLDYDVSGLVQGQYTVRVIEPYRHPDDEPLEFLIELTSSPSSGSHCVRRSHYPWGY
ncbi:MAG: dockerin type I repeat-containing protein [Candidatus Zixiibacteriota bacterium]